MNLAIASKEDIKRMWSIYRNADRIFAEYSQPELEELINSMHSRYSGSTRLRRCLAVILDKLNYSGGFMRVVAGCEVLIDECCDPNSDVYATKPEIDQGYADTKRLNWMIEHQGQLRSPEHGESIELRFIHNGTQHFNGSGVDTPRELIDRCMAQTASTPAPAVDCHRAHPHEEMNEECHRKTAEVKAAHGSLIDEGTKAPRYASDVESDGSEL